MQTENPAMNKTYRLIWNEFTRTWVAVGEIAKARGKRASGVVLLAAAGILVTPVPPAFAVPPSLPAAPAATQLPTGGKVVAGAASVSQAGSTMNVNQGSQRAAIDWSTSTRKRSVAIYWSCVAFGSGRPASFF
jgi:hypothetical protein